MKKIIGLNIILILASMCFSAVIFAETVVLKSGVRIEGKILERTDKFVTIDINGVAVTYNAYEIDTVLVRESEEPEEIQEGSARWHYRKGIEYGMEGKYEGAKKEFEEILDDDSYQKSAKSWIKKIDKALEGTVDKQFFVYFFRATNYVNKDMYGEAISEYIKALEINPKDAEVYELLGECYWRVAYYDDAVEAWRRAIALDSGNINAHINLGLHYEGKRMFQEAISEYKKALVIDSNNIDALVNLGAVYNNKGMLDEAIVVLEKAVSLDPNCVAAHNNLAVVYFQKEQYKMAIEHCDKVIELGTEVNPELLEKLKPYR